MPFTVDQFLEVFRNYNISVYPMQIFFYLLGAIVIIFSFKRTLISDKIISIVIAFLWLWMGVIYHFIYFARINKAAYLFGAAFILQGLLFLLAGVLNNKLSFRFRRDIFGITGAIFILYALILYPVFGFFMGHVYPASPTFGLPCQTTIFTFGILLWFNKRPPLSVLIIPFIWSIIGFVAALSLGMLEDIGLLFSGLICLLMLATNYKKSMLPAQ